MSKKASKKSLKKIIVGAILALTIIGNLYGFPVIGISVSFPWEDDNPQDSFEECIEKYRVSDNVVPAICSYDDSRCTLLPLERMRGFPLIINRSGSCSDGYSSTASLINFAVGVGSLLYLVKLVRPETKGKKKNAKK